eukprot:gene10666-biopygen4378
MKGSVSSPLRKLQSGTAEYYWEFTLFHNKVSCTALTCAAGGVGILMQPRDGGEASPPHSSGAKGEKCGADRPRDAEEAAADLRRIASNIPNGIA